LNRQGATLVEVLIAGTLLVALVAGFGYLLKFSLNYLATANNFSRAIYAARSTMEEIHRLPFDKVSKMASPKIKIAPLSADLLGVAVEIAWHPKRTPVRLYSLRGKD